MIKVEVRNLNTVIRNFKALEKGLPATLKAANDEGAREILDTEGLRKYPPAGPANQPPVPYYIRGRGTQTAIGNKLNSQRLGSQWNVAPYGRIGMKISNPVDYAQYVHGENQASFMASKGWRKLLDVATEKIGIIGQIYEKWLQRLIESKGL